MIVPGYKLRGLLPRADAPPLFRAASESDGLAVLIKQADLSAHSTIALQREAAILREVRAPGIPGLVEFVPSASALVLEDRGGMPLCSQVPAGGLPVEAFFAIAGGLSVALGGLHRAGFVHRYLAPSAVLVDWKQGFTRLLDFAFASRIPEEAAPLGAAQSLGPRLAYASPEQTGRMNRVVDYRSDFYSLGAILHYVLTARPPFSSSDPLELVHAHIARLPAPPSSVVPGLAQPVSDIVMKLLAKNAEDRYQSVAGLQADLEDCAAYVHAGGDGSSRSHRGPSFSVGRRDSPRRLLIPQRLYGREAEVEAMLRAFEDAASGPALLMLVSGYSGIGKTALVREIHKPVTRRRGLFLSGKFDQLARSTPYSALSRAFRGLPPQILHQPEEHVAASRSALRETLGPNAGVVTAVVPELQALVGAGEPPPEAGPTESENRFYHAFQRLVSVVARPDQPLVLFVDDLQWADPASLKLLTALLVDPLVSHLFVIGAYRDNEVASGHPLLRAVEELCDKRRPTRTITLPPLTRVHLTALVGDALGIEPARADELARVVLAKTDGNPFFVTQFLKSLEADGLLWFEESLGRLEFDSERIARAAITDNVVDLMSRKLRRLPAATQNALALAACIGNGFTLGTLATIREASGEEVAHELWPAIEGGFVVPASDRYEMLADRIGQLPTGGADLGFRFLHDRMQQAAYAVIEAGHQQRLHLRVGRLLLADSSVSERSADRLFEIVDHLNVGRSLIADERESQELAWLNLDAGRKAKAAAAFQAALDYLEVGVTLAGSRAWEVDAERSYGLHLEHAECLSLCGRFADAEQAFRDILLRVRTRLERAGVYKLIILQYEARGRYTEAVRAAREVLSLFDIEWPGDPAAVRTALDRELDQIRSLQGERRIEALLDLPAASDPEVRALMRLLFSLHTSLYLSGEQTLTLLNTSLMVRLSLVHGHAEESAHAYMLHALHVGQIRGDHAAAFEFGRLALRLSDRLPDRSVRAKVVMNFSWAVSLWRRPMRESFGWAREAFRLGNETGMFVDAGYAAFNETYFRLLEGSDLTGVEPAVDEAVAYMRRVKMDGFVDAPRVIGRWAAALRGRSAAPTSLDGDGFTEQGYAHAHDGHALFEMFLFSAKLALDVTFGEHERALATADRAAHAIAFYRGTIWDELHVFHCALALTATCAARPADDRARSLERLHHLAARLRHWADNCPENFRAQERLVAAEIFRVTGLGADAARCYEEAVAASASSDSPRDRALSHELYARFWLERRQLRVAAVYFAEARAAWAAWGASAKVADLERRHGELLFSVAPGPAATALEAGALDLATAMKAAQAISREIERPRLLRSLVRIAMENAGAERGLLLHERDGQLLIAAEGRIGSEGVVLPDAPAAGRIDVPWTVVQLARRTGEAVRIADASADEQWLSDPYIRDAAVRSVLCVPLVHQGKHMGVLYLENNLTAHAFGGQRAEILQVLASQAGVALENARLYEQLQAHKDRLQAENAYLQEEIRTEHNFEEVVGRSPALLDALAAVERVARTDSTVLVLGETGVGKELFARAIHSRSGRRERPLVKVNCGAIADGLVESELFGHVKGAFTGALQRRVGRFELADGGTIFLDEVGELAPETQVKLLRVLQEREFEPVGSSRTIRVDVRIIAATNRDLSRAVREGRFRADLLYRLNVFPLRIPSLAERRSDIPLLIAFFRDAIGKRLGKTLDGFPPHDLDRLLAYRWPGNVRELENVVERAAILAQGSTLHLHPRALGEDGGAEADPDSGSTRGQTLEEVERAHIRRVLEATGGVVEGPRGAAQVLGMNPNTLRSRMKKLGVNPRPVVTLGREPT